MYIIEPMPLVYNQAHPYSGSVPHAIFCYISCSNVGKSYLFVLCVDEVEPDVKDCSKSHFVTLTIHFKGNLG